MYNFKCSSTKSKNFSLKFEELPAFGEFVETSFLLDRELFAAFSPRYAKGFAEEYRNKLEAAKQLTVPQVLTGERKKATENLYATMDAVLVLMEKLQHYCILATEEKLSFHVVDLRIPELRISLRRHNSEASILGAKSVQQLVQKDLPVLEEAGFTKERQEELKNLILTMESTNKAQNDLLNERRRLIEDNTALLNELWEMIRNIMSAGRIIHRDNPLRKTEYTVKNLKSRVRLVISPKPEDESEKPPEEVKTEEAAKKEESVAAL
jgi:hypothetical protein